MTSYSTERPLLERAVEAADAFESWPQRVCAALTAFLGYVAAEPTPARSFMEDALPAGPASARDCEEPQQAFVSLLRLGRDVSPYGAELPATTEEAIAGGVIWIVHKRLINPAEGEIASMLPELIEFALTPYLGVEAAREMAAAGDGRGAWTASAD